jgi:pyruvate dehydrogenase E2 component (dihydrolipoamide acetyltransferase)
MPRLSDSMEEGTILAWLRRPGELIARGDELCEIETDKATMVYEADREGPLTIVVAAGETVAVGELIAYIGEAAADPAAAEEPPASAPPAGADAPSVGSEAAPTAAPGPTPPRREGRVLASPLARRVAQERGISLAGRSGSRRGGRIVKADVIAWAEEGAATPTLPPATASPPPADAAAPGVEVVELSRVQALIARRMAETQATVPDFQVTVAVSMDAAADLRRRLAATVAEDAPVPSFNDLIVKAAAVALRRHPRVNGAYVDGRFNLHAAINVAIAVAGVDSLMTPPIVEADRLGLGEIAARSRRLALRCRDGSITPPELAGGTFTVSNLGMFGVESFTAIINSPQAAILAVGGIVEEPVVRGGELAIGKVMRMTLSCDHRILYGADAAAFLADVRGLLEEPLRMLL